MLVLGAAIEFNAGFHAKLQTSVFQFFNETKIRRYRPIGAGELGFEVWYGCRQYVRNQSWSRY